MDAAQDVIGNPGSSKVILFEDDRLILFYRPGRSPFTLITFSNYGFSANKNLFWGEPLCDREDIDSFGFVAKEPNWFPSNSMEKAATCVSPTDRRPIITYGHSQGGYAALKYSSMLNATGVFSSCPQYSIDPSTVPEDPRYVKDFNDKLHNGMEIKKQDVMGRIMIAFDPCDRLDKYHVDMIRALGLTKYFEFHIHHLGHDVMEVLVNRPLIMGLLDSLISERINHNLYLESRRLKKASNRYGARLAEYLLAKNKATTATRVLDVVKSNNRGFVHSRDKILLALIRTKTELALKNYPRAVEQMELVTSYQPDNAHYHGYLGHCLVAAGRTREAVAAFTRAVSLRPDIAPFQDTLLKLQQRLLLEERTTQK